VLFIYRAEYYKLEQFEDGSPTQGVSEIIIAKHRNGAVGDVKLKFVADYAKFEDYAQDYGSGTHAHGDINAGIKSFSSKMNSDVEDEDPPY